MQPSLSVVLPYAPGEAARALQAARECVHVPGAQVVLAGAEPPSEVPTGVEWVRAAGGRGAALRAAIPSLRAEHTVIQDADAAYTPGPWPALLAPLRSGEADAVWGRRVGIPIPDAAVGRLASWVSSTRLHDPLSGQKALRTELLRAVPLTASDDSVDAELLVKLAARLYRLVEVPVHVKSMPHRRPMTLASWTRALLRYATTANDADNLHEGYNTLVRLEEGARNYNAWLGRKFRAHCGARVLEIGAGIGTITDQLAREGREKVVAVEVDPFYVERLQNRFRGRPEVVPWLSSVELADWKALAAERFDSVVMSNVLEHIEDDGGAVRKLHRILPEGGRLLLFVPALPVLYGSIDEAVGHYRRYSEPGLRAVLEQNGFEVESLEWMNLLAAPAWFLNGRVLRRRAVPPLQLRLYDTVAPLLAAAEEKLRLPVGSGLFCVARRRPGDVP